MDTDLIQKAYNYVKDAMIDQGAGHGWDHVERVYNNTQLILLDNFETKPNQTVTILGALFHDIGDAKFNDGVDRSPELTKKVLTEFEVPNSIIQQVVHVVESISFRKMKSANELSLEAKIVQDADRLDALGAVGIVRCIEYSAHVNRPFYDKDIQPKFDMSKEEYTNHEGTAFNHFYEKLFLLTDQMHTNSAKKIALKREQYMKTFLDQYLAEIEGKR